MSFARALSLGKGARTTTERTVKSDFRSCLDRVPGTYTPNLADNILPTAAQFSSHPYLCSP